jgi:uncharacterized protein with FMN-binding domain
MKKFIIAGAIVVVFAAYAIYQHNQTNKTSVVSANTTINQTPVSDTPPTNPTAPATNTPASPIPAPKSTPTPTTPAGQFKDGEYTGDVADAFYGKVQVKAVVANGKLTDVQFLQYPNDRGETAQISTRMMPILKSEVTKAQSANVDIVSGATQSSEAFVKSLQSALNQAKA